MARARNVTHQFALRARGVAAIERELFEASLRSARSVLEALGTAPHEARRQAMRFRDHNLALVDAMQAHQGDRDRLISLTRQGRAQLEEQLAKEREAQRSRPGRGWG